MIRIYFLLVLCLYYSNFAIHQPAKKYNEKSTQKLIQIIERRNETIGGSNYNKEETVQSVRTLIKQGANPNALNSQGRNVLWLAITLRNKPLLQCILHTGTNVNQEDNKGDTPLKFAISQMAIEVLKMLIASGADVNHQSESKFCIGKTPLMVVFHLGRKIKLTIVDMLLRANANVFLKDGSGQTVLHYAVAQADLQIIDRFFSFNHCGVLLNDIADRNDVTPLYIARNNPQVLALLQQGAQKVK